MQAKRSGYKHWKNDIEPGTPAFCSSTCLDFIHVFEEGQIRDIVVASILDDCRYYGANLSAFVVMASHVHLLLVAPEDRTVSWLMDRIKSNAARRVLPHLSEAIKHELSIQRGLNQRTVWQVSFRSLGVSEEKTFWQKVRYIHLNPVRAKLAEAPEDYRWSSAWMWEKGLWNDETGLEVTNDLIELFSDRDLLDLGKIQKGECEAYRSRLLILNSEGGIEG